MSFEYIKQIVTPDELKAEFPMSPELVKIKKDRD